MAGVAVSAVLLALPAQGWPGEGMVACIKIGETGRITDSYVLVSSGDSHLDEMLLREIHILHWPAGKPDKPRNTWFPFTVQPDPNRTPPKAPDNCGPPTDGQLPKAASNNHS